MDSNNKKNWIKIYSSPFIQEVEIRKALLADYDIESVIINKQDSMYINFNTTIPVELYVSSDNFLKAKHTLNKLDNE